MLTTTNVTSQSSILRLRHKAKKQKQVRLSSTAVWSSTTLLWAIATGLFPMLSMAQESLSLPELEQLEPIPQERERLPIGTFNRLNAPPEDTAPPLYDRQTSEQFSVYRLDTGDGVSITVPLYPEFNAVTSINAEGEVIIPILGRISLAGLTIQEVESKVSYELSRRFLQEPPEVLANLTTTRPAQVSILGEVVRPGFYNFTAGSPVLAALQAAGGSTENADLRSIIIRRPLIDGSIMEQKVDLYNPLIQGRTAPELRLQGGDTIIVSRLGVGEDRDYDRSFIANTTLPRQTINIRVVVPVDTGTAIRNISVPNGSTFIDAISALPPDDNLLIKEEVALVRFDPQKGGVVTQTLNVEDVVQSDLSQNVPLQNEDVIVVSRTLIGKVFSAFDIISRPIRSFFGFRSFFDFFFDN